MYSPFLLCIHAQDESAIRSIISENDLKKLVKADDYRNEADILIGESNRLNMEVFTVQSNPELDEKAISKKVKQLELQAQQKQIQASLLYEKSNEIKFTVYKQYIDEFWSTHEGQESDYLNAKLLEEQSSDHYFQAFSYRIEAKKMDGIYAKVEKLSEANTLENQAIQKQLTALGQYHQIADTSTDTHIPEQEPQIPLTEPLPDSANTLESEQFTAEPPFQEQSPVTPETDANRESGLQDSVIVNPSMIDADNRYIATGQFTDTAMSTSEVSGVTSPLGLNRLPSGTLFRIQVAESKVPLTAGQLKKIYAGNYPVEMITEDGWYKYQLMGVRLYSDAVQMVQTINTAGVFISAYENGNKVELTDAVNGTKELERNVSTHGRKGTIQEIEFHIQLAASRIRLSPEEIKEVYSGDEPVSVIIEDGWYKYHLKAGNSPETAEQLRQSCGVPQAFVVHYKRAAKINLYQALQELK